jgi:2-C-methyl-D-erythritol 4-phosphate cytidylyltransferase
LLIHYGERVYFAKGTTSNIKVTKKEDLALFGALLKVPEDLLFS